MRRRAIAARTCRRRPRLPRLRRRRRRAERPPLRAPPPPVAPVTVSPAGNFHGGGVGGGGVGGGGVFSGKLLRENATRRELLDGDSAFRSYRGALSRIAPTNQTISGAMTRRGRPRSTGAVSSHPRLPRVRFLGNLRPGMHDANFAPEALNDRNYIWLLFLVLVLPHLLEIQTTTNRYSFDARIRTCRCKLRRR